MIGKTGERAELSLWHCITWKDLNIYIMPSLKRRISMLDVIIVLVTILTFLLLIGFTEGCERL